MTILDCCISLKTNKKILVVLGVVDMRQLLLRSRPVNLQAALEKDTTVLMPLQTFKMKAFYHLLKH